MLMLQSEVATPKSIAAIPPCTFKIFLTLAPEVGADAADVWAAPALVAAPELAAELVPEVVLVILVMVEVADDAPVDAADDALAIVEAALEALDWLDSTVFFDSTTNSGVKFCSLGLLTGLMASV